MTPERLAEIRKKVSVGVYYSDTLVRELLDHIAQLEAQRGELARELDLTKREAWTAKERHKDERDRADGLRERLDELSAEEFARAQRGGAVVVPELTDEEISARFWANIPDSDETWYKWALRDYRWAYYLAVSRIQPIPADRVLADGMVGVDRKVLTDLREGLQNILDEIPNGEDQGEGYTDPVEIQCWKIREAKSALDALRAQQAKRE